MKLTKTLAALCVMGGALLAFSACKDSSGDGNTSGAPSDSGVSRKYALQMTLDATGDNIKVGGKAINDSNGDSSAVSDIRTDTEEGKTDSSGEHASELQRCGKRYFEEISAGFNNTEGFRTNIVLDVKNGTWVNSGVTTNGNPRTAIAGMLFDFNKYKDAQDKDIYDFFYLAFKPTIGANGITGVTAFFERYSGVKKTDKGIYTSDKAASALGSNYIPTDVNGTWDDTLYTPDQNKTWSKTLQNTDWYKDNDGNAIIGVDVKQIEKGVFTVRIGKISYTVGETAQPFTPSIFKQTWQTTFAGGTTMGKGGETSTKTGDSGYIKDYLNWTHVEKNNKDSNLKGGVLVYGFAPYGTRPIACYYTCNTKLTSNTADNTTSRYDYVGDWNVANELDVDGVETKVFYEEGNVVHKYIYY
ncbi:MAG: hypothetical protein K6A42_11820 [Treponema sp.]|nr:hypothetical protein [Treponema sp.]